MVKKFNYTIVTGQIQHFRLLVAILIATAAALPLSIVHYSEGARWLLAIVCLAAAGIWAYRLYENVRSAMPAILLLPLAAVITALILKQFWAALVLVLFTELSSSLYDVLQRQSKTEALDTMKQIPAAVSAIRGKKITTMSVRDIEAGTRLQLSAGDIVPVDGFVIEGRAAVDESRLTGDTTSVTKEADSRILSGSRVMSGTIVIKASATASRSAYQLANRLVPAALESQAPAVRVARRYSVFFTIYAFGAASIGWVSTHQPMRFLDAIIIAATSPLVLGPSLAITQALNRLARHSVLPRTAASFENLARARSIAFNKNGTLTEPDLSVRAVHSFGRFSGEKVLAYSASLAALSIQATAQAITRTASERSLKVPRARHGAITPGQGITATLDGKKAVLGRLLFLEKQGVDIPANLSSKTIEEAGIYFSLNGELLGAVAFTDQIRPESPEVIRRLKRNGINKFILVTGDSKRQAQLIAQKARIGEVHAAASPADKLRIVQSEAMRPIIFVANQPSDAPVLTGADVGMAFAAYRSASLIESADIIVLPDKLSLVSYAVTTAKRTLRLSHRIALWGSSLAVVAVLLGASGLIAPVYGALIQGLIDTAVILGVIFGNRFKI